MPSPRGIDPLGADRVPHEALRLLVEQDLARRGGVLEPRRHGHGVARDEGGGRMSDHLAGVHAGADGEGDVPVALELRGQPVELVSGLGRSTDRAQCIVLVDGRHAEDPDHAAGGRGLGAGAVPLEHTGDRLDRLLHRAPERLGVPRAAERQHVRGHHRDGLARLPRGGLGRLRRRLLGRRRPELERGVLREHGALDPLELRARLEAELLDQRLARVLVDLQRLGLPTRAVEREHQLGAEALPERMRRRQRLELRHELGVAAGREPGLDPVLDRRHPELREPGDLGPRERGVGEVGEHGPAPERERLVPRARAEQLLEALGVQLAGLDAEQVPRAPRHQAGRARAASAAARRCSG